MKIWLVLGVAAATVVAAGGASPQIPNQLIDYPAFLARARQVEAVRAARRLTEDAFLAAMAEPGVVLLDARSAAKFKLRHVRGAVNLSLPDFTAEELAKHIPSKGTKVLIYCNNNFLGSPVALPSKAPAASLNISTYVTLATYGYTNVYELGPLIELAKSRLPFAGDEVSN